MAIDTIPLSVAKRSIFQQEFRSVIEDHNIFHDVATVLIARAKNILSPFTGVGEAKIHQVDCVVPVTPSTLTVDELVLDRYIGNALTECDEVLNDANFDAKGELRRDLYASVLAGLNKDTASNILADATSGGGAVALATQADVFGFITEVEANMAFAGFSAKQTVDGATVKRPSHFGKPFIVAGTTAYVAILKQLNLISLSSTDKGLTSKQVYTPSGILIVNAGPLFSNAKQMIYGVAGAPTIGYREDMIEVDSGVIRSDTVFGGASPSLQLNPGDPILKKTNYILAQTKGNSGVFANVSHLVLKRLMA